MSEPFLAEVRIVGFNFAPRGWAFCDGQILPINQNQSLYSLLGTTYGGDGRTSFALPDLRSRVPIHVGNGFRLGQKSGEETVTIDINAMPGHTHSISAAQPPGANPVPIPNDKVMAQAPATDPIYWDATDLVNMNSQSIANNGGGQSHENMQPFLTLSFCIALRGVFPSRN